MNPLAAPPITEAQWQQQVIDLAHALHWQHCHVRRTIGKGRRWTTATSVVGWPDLILWSETQQRILYVELKTDTGKATPEQLKVLGSLAQAGAEVHLWRPHQLDHVHQVLKGTT